MREYVSTVDRDRAADAEGLAVDGAEAAGEVVGADGRGADDDAVHISPEQLALHAAAGHVCGAGDREVRGRGAAGEGRESGEGRGGLREETGLEGLEHCPRICAVGAERITAGDADTLLGEAAGGEV